SEPDIVSPVAMEFDENGDLYVVEDRGYPLNVTGKLGRIKLLRDSNGDGVPDKVTVFADNLVMPTGVMRWKKGILVTDAPDLIYLEDTNHDGVADVRKVILTGFAFTNPQHTVNNPLYGLDNWIYLAHENAATAIIFKDEFGDRGSDIRYVDRQGVPPLTEHGRNIRFRPDTGQLESLATPSQFGHSFDDWNRHFLVSNSAHIRQEAIAARYLKRNPDLPVASAVEDISDHMPASKVYPVTDHPRFELLSGVGEFTSACGITFYRGSTFVAEPAHNLVHQDQILDSGSLYAAKRAQNNSEFLASTDAWFRPVNMTVGPDGALYLMDYYRMVIEHPEWMSSHHHHSAELTKGTDRGRIYRIVPDAGVGTLKGIRLGSASDEELVKQLANPVIWWRRTAQRLLMDRHAVQAAPALIRLFQETSSPQGRVHALWTLEGLGVLEPALILKALDDQEPGVRENAIVLAEQHMTGSPELQKRLPLLAGDASARVRYQLMLTLGNIKTPAAQSARDRMLFGNIEDKWLQIAALSAASAEAPRLFEQAILSGGAESPGRTTLFRYVSAVIGARQQPAEMERLLASISGRNAEKAWWRTSSLDGLTQGIRTRRGSVSAKGKMLLLSLFERGEARVQRAALQALQIAGLPPGAGADAAIRQAAKTASDNTANADLRANSIGLLALFNPESHKQTFAALIDPHQPEAVQEAAVTAYGKIRGDDIGKALLAKWRTLTPAVRGDAADAMYLEPSRERLLVTALQHGDVQPWTLAFRHKRRLIMNSDPAVRDAARPLLEQTPKDREAVVKQYDAALTAAGDWNKGQEVFRSICSKCHRLNGYGSEVGPDLGTVRNQPKQVLLSTILMPNQSIAQGYESYVVETNSGGNFDGVIGPQTPTTITLRHENGKEDVIPRQDIKNMYVTNLSAMPADLEKQITIKQMADLLEYLKTAQ
ncbi:MAG TPA: PVC-type heme-binding CxxCH protein, partial [Bryobacteraceae bacterium]|nr:PVC-type heme-binding CxxCH protein [Bryobacteraceae bacterium]